MSADPGAPPVPAADSPRVRRRWLLLAAVIAAAVLTAAFLPPTIGLRWGPGGLYHVGQSFVAFPECIQIPAPPGPITNVTLNDVAFSFRISSACLHGGIFLSGNVTAAGGTPQSFAIGGPPGATHYTWFAPDGRAGIEWWQTNDVLLFTRV